MLRKALAKQTAAATREIRQRIDGIQSSSQSTSQRFNLRRCSWCIVSHVDVLYDY